MAGSGTSEPPLSLASGIRLGPYVIEDLLGAGGMGEVYRASDSRLDRSVALKLLPAAFASDPDRLARFAREAKLLASLSHPNIAHVYGFETAVLPGGQEAHLLAMELVAGEDLKERLKRGAIPVEAALDIARQIADALEVAHDKGIVHRDLKPANVKLAPDGRVKVLDFGLAKAFASGRPAEETSEAPTQSMPLTQAGAIFGTPAYMSPEQARGLPVDKRADVWAFGCVLFEMLAGQKPFDGQTTTDALAAVLAREPEWKRLPETTPTALRRLLRRCLEKDAARRLRDIADARIELDDASRPSEGESVAASLAPPRIRRAWLAILVMLALAVVASGPVWRRLSAPAATPSPLVRTSIVLPPGQKLYSGSATHSLALSADARKLAYVGEQEGRTLLYVRDLGSLESKPLAGTSGAMHPFFSPDGEWVGYFERGALQKVAVAGGAPLRVCAVASPSRGASWGRDGRIVFALHGSGLYVVDAAGGVPRALGAGEDARWPEVLPDGRTVLFTTRGALAIVPMDGGAMRVIGKTNDSVLEGPAVLGTGTLAQARYLRSGHLVYGQSPGIVRAAPFDLATGSFTGPVASVVASVERSRNQGAVYFSVSETGVLVYAPTGYRHQLVWVDRSGAATPISPERASFRYPRVSPDGARLVVAVNDETRRGDVWIYDAQLGTKRRLTAEGHNGWPLWTRDGRNITFTSGGTLHEVPADGSGPPRVLVARSASAPWYPTSWSPNGRELLFEADEVVSSDVGVVVPPVGQPNLLLSGPSDEQDAQFSPDGRFVAYRSDESGRSEVYVASYPSFKGRTAISTDGGTVPRWSRDGRELFFRQGDALMAASVDTRGDFRAERPRRLFAGSYDGEGRHGAYDIAPDGQRFVMVKDDEASSLRELTVVQGWFEELRRLAPARR